MRFLRTTIATVSILLIVGFWGYRMEMAPSTTAPNLSNTYTPLTQSAPSGVGSFDVLGHVAKADEAVRLLQTEAGQQQLFAENGAVEITEDLLKLGRKAFYTETFGNEIFLTDITRVLDGPITLPKMAKAIAANRHDSRLQNSFVEGIGHSYWVDQNAGYTSQEQSDLVQFLLSLDDQPEV